MIFKSRFRFDLSSALSRWLDFREHTTDFVRNRKFNFRDVVLFILQRRAISAKMELYHYFKKKGSDITMSPTALKNQRMKLKPALFQYLMDVHNHSFYEEEDDVKTYKDHLLIAIDGSDITLPTTPELMDTYGYSQGQQDHRHTAMATLSCAYDVLNGMILDSYFGAYRTSEREMALKHRKKVDEMLKQKKIYIMDRGYFSFEMIYRFRQEKFVFRLGKNALKKEKEKMENDDGWITIEYTPSRIGSQEDEETKRYMEEQGRDKLRMTKIILEGGEEEYLLSDLGEEYTKEELAEIYRKRWKEETVYRTIKNSLKIENFSGVTGRLIEQDIYSTLYVSNVIQDNWQNAQKQIDEKKYKNKTQINRNIEIGIWKDRVIEIYETEDEEEMMKKEEAFEKKLMKYLTTTKEGKHNERRMIKKPRRYYQNQKNSY